MLATILDVNLARGSFIVQILVYATPCYISTIRGRTSTATNVLPVFYLFKSKSLTHSTWPNRAAIWSAVQPAEVRAFTSPGVLFKKVFFSFRHRGAKNAEYGKISRPSEFAQHAPHHHTRQRKQSQKSVYSPGEAFLRKLTNQIQSSKIKVTEHESRLASNESSFNFSQEQ